MRFTPIRRRATSSRISRRQEAGYALLTLVFFTAIMILGASVAVPRLLTQGRREKEEETIWRGEQYVRGIRLYYRKFGRFPKSLEDLNKGQNNLHFLRKPYKDVMNREDGSWRMIYVGPMGQLIGSVTRLTAGLNPLGAQNILPGPGKPAPNPLPQPPPRPVPDAPPDPQDLASSPDDTSLAGQQGVPVTSQPPTAPNKAIQGAGTVQGQVFGGNLIGVGSKVNRNSLKFYKGFGKYNEWEFIWDPMADAGPGGASSVQPNPFPGGQNPPQPAPISQPPQ
jgi:type II secretory pathway pseudopilin PulG